MDFADIGKELVNGRNTGGLAMKFYFGLHADVESFPTEPTSPATLAAAAALTGDITMKAGKRMFEFSTTEDTAKLDFNPIGEEGGKGVEIALTIHAPGLSSKLLGFMNATRNEDLVLIVEDNEGQKYLMGNELRSAKLKSADGAGTGAVKEGKRGIPMVFSFYTGAVYIYTGSIPLTAGASV
jgi:hypothetical protein